jgi:hypothetical protein
MKITIIPGGVWWSQELEFQFASDGRGPWKRDDEKGWKERISTWRQ